MFPFARSFPLGGNFKAELTAGIGFTVERLSNGGGAADVAKGKDFNLEIAAVVGDAKHVTDADFAGRLGGLAVRLNAAEFAGARGKRASLEEPGSPQPFVDSHCEALLKAPRQRLTRILTQAVERKHDRFVREEIADRQGFRG